MMSCGNIFPSPPTPSPSGRGVTGGRGEGTVVRIVLAFALVLLPAALYAAPATVSLHEQVVVPPGTLTLGQLAEIAGEQELTGQLVAVEIGRSPLPGHQRTITAGYVRMRIARAGFAGKAVALTGARAVLVRRETPVAATGSSSSGLSSEAVATGGVGESAAAGRTAGPAPPVLLRRGERVQLVVISGGIVISTSGQLLQQAAMGESVMVRVANTGQKVCGVLTGPRRVTIGL